MSNAACASVGLQRAWDDKPAGVNGGVAVRPSLRMEGCSDEARCSFPVGPMAALAAGDGSATGSGGGGGTRRRRRKPVVAARVTRRGGAGG